MQRRGHRCRVRRARPPPCPGHLGHRSACADIDDDRVARLNKGEIPILEDGLPELVAEGLASRRLRFVVGAAERGPRRPSSCSSACRPRRATTARPTSRSSRRSRARSRRCCARARWSINKSTMPVGSTRLVAARSSAEAGAAERRRRRVEPRVPPRGHRGPRLPPAEPRRDRLRRPRGRGARQRALPRACTRRSSSPTPRRPR